MRVQRSSGVLDAAITCDGEGLGSHAGALLLMRLADRIGLTDGLDARPAARRARRSKHRPGRVLRDIAVVLADGGDCLSDIAVLAQQPGLFGEVASQPTAWNVLEAVADDELGGVDGIRQLVSRLGEHRSGLLPDRPRCRTPPLPLQVVSPTHPRCVRHPRPDRGRRHRSRKLTNAAYRL